MTQQRVLVLSCYYPSSNDPYAGMFVHARVKRYQESGLRVDVFCYGEPLDRQEAYDGVSVTRGDGLHLERCLKAAAYDKILIHGVLQGMMEVLERVASNTPLIVWIHGFETENWRRRLFDYRWSPGSIFLLPRIIAANRAKLRFIRRLYEGLNCRRDLEFVFVSRWFKEQVAERDARCRVRRWHIIPNFIDERRFAFLEKPPSQRNRVLCIRSFNSRKYANDLMAAAIAELSRQALFGELEFRIMGDGKLFDQTVEPLRRFRNVEIARGFLQPDEVAAVHRHYGVFLCPTRLDAQGVSMCEAMSSGLVPVSTRVSAIPEFVSDEDGILARKENYTDLVQALQFLHDNPSTFTTLSLNAARRIRKTCGYQATIERELRLISAGLVRGQ